MAEVFGLGRIGQVMVPVRDLGRATAFYRDTLGMRLLMEVPRMAFFDCAGVRLMLGAAEAGAGEGAPGASIVYYDVPDIGAAHAELASRGVAFVEAPAQVADLGDRVLWLAFFRDSEDNVLALMSEVAKAAS